MEQNDQYAEQLLTGAVEHLNRFVLAGCPRSCAIACVLLANLAERMRGDVRLGEACRALAETLETLTALPETEREQLAPWLGAAVA